MILALFLVFLAAFVILPIVGLALWAFLSTVVVGLIIGGLGRLVVPGTQPIGLLATALAGLIGSILGAFVGYHVLGVGRIATFLLEVGFSAVVVAGFSYSARHSLSGPDQPPLGRGRL